MCAVNINVSLVPRPLPEKERTRYITHCLHMGQILSVITLHNCQDTLLSTWVMYGTQKRFSVSLLLTIAILVNQR